MTANSRVETYLQQLKMGDAIARKAAILHLSAVPRAVETAIPTLVQALQDPDDGVRINAALALRELRDASFTVISALIQAASFDKNSGVRINAISSLGHFLGIGGHSASLMAHVLSEILKADKDERVRGAAALALGRGEGSEQTAVAALAEALADSSIRVRLHAAFALGKIGASAETAIPALTKALEDSDKQVRGIANRSLQQIRELR